MRKERTLFIIGLFTSILPFLGFPSSWRDFFFVLIGFSLIYLAYLYYIETKERLSKIIKDDSSKAFIDNINNGSNNVI